MIYNFNFLIISRYFHFFLFFLSLSCFWSTYENNSMKGDNLFSIVRGEDYLLSGERLIYDLQVLQKKKKKKERFNTVKSVAEIEKLEDKEKGEKGNMCWPSSLYPPHNFWMTLFQGKGGWSRIVVSTRFQNVGRWPIVLQCFSKLKSQFFISNVKRKKKHKRLKKELVKSNSNSNLFDFSELEKNLIELYENDPLTWSNSSRSFNILVQYI